MMNLRLRVEELFKKHRRGALTESELYQSLFWGLVDSALVQNDPGLPEVLEFVAAALPVDVEEFSLVPYFITQARDDGDILHSNTSLARASDIVNLRVSEALSDDICRGNALLRLADFPARWSSEMLVESALSAQFTSDEELRVYEAIYRIAVATYGGSRAFNALVEPVLKRDDREAARYLAKLAGLIDELDSRHWQKMLPRVRERTGLLSTTELVDLAVALTIRANDVTAHKCATELWARSDRNEHQTLITAAVFSMLGYASEASEIVEVVRNADFSGWWQQGSDSLRAYLLAQSAEGEDLLMLLASRKGDHPGKSIASVGALVARMAFMRMMAYLQIGETDMATQEALSVLTYHAYHGTDLHVARSDFDARLVSRLAVTALELEEARRVVRRSKLDPDAWVPLLMEGVLYPRSAH